MGEQSAKRGTHAILVYRGTKQYWGTGNITTHFIFFIFGEQANQVTPGRVSLFHISKQVIVAQCVVFSVRGSDAAKELPRLPKFDSYRTIN